MGLSLMASYLLRASISPTPLLLALLQVRALHPFFLSAKIPMLPYHLQSSITARLALLMLWEERVPCPMTRPYLLRLRLV